MYFLCLYANSTSSIDKWPLAVIFMYNSPTKQDGNLCQYPPPPAVAAKVWIFVLSNIVLFTFTFTPKVGSQINLHEQSYCIVSTYKVNFGLHKRYSLSKINLLSEEFTDPVSDEKHLKNV